MSGREILLVLHPNRPEARNVATEIVSTLSKEGIGFISTVDPGIPGVNFIAKEDLPKRLSGIELTLVLGGDGTILRGAEQIHGTNIPVLGINWGTWVSWPKSGNLQLQQSLAQLRIRNTRLRNE